MQVTTTRRDGSAVNKPFAWSYSRLKNFETCPKRSWHIDIVKDVREEESEQLKWGNMLHAAAAARLSGKKIPLTADFGVLSPWIERFEKTPGDILVEQKLAIAKDFGACDWFAKGERAAWLRVVIDVLKINGAVALAADWKTGKIKEDSVQLALNAACIFAHFPQIQRLRTEFIWLAEDASSRADFSREDMPGLWRSVLPRVDAMRHAHETQSYPAKPGGICKRWCPVEKCPHWGEG